MIYSKQTKTNILLPQIQYRKSSAIHSNHDRQNAQEDKTESAKQNVQHATHKVIITKLPNTE